MAYTDVFTGSSTSPSDVSYLALAPAGSSTTQLTWPELDGTTPFSRIIRVTPGGASAVIKLPAANLRGPGEDVLFQNVGSDTFAVQDYDGTEVATVAAGTAKYIYLTDNSTDHGAWTSVAFGSGSSATDASQVAGYGMDVANSKLVVDFAVSSNTSGVTVATTDRGKAFVFTAGSVTVALPAVATATDGFYFGVRNSGTGTVTVDPNGAELVDGASTLAMAPGESALIVCSGSAWYSYGYGRSVAFAITQLTKDLTGLTTYTITAAEAANKMVKFVGSLSANCTVTVPDAASVYFLQNATSVAVAETVTVKTSAGSGVTLSTGDRQVVYSDGTNVVSATTTTVTAPASVPAGAEGAPSLYFSGDTDTGFYSAGTNAFGITAGGTKRFEVSSTATTSVVPIVAQDDLTVTGDGVFNGTLKVPTATAPAQTGEGLVVWDSNDDLLTVGDGTSRKTMADTAGTQTLTNKTMGSGSVWNGGAIGVAYGGTNIASYAVGDLIYASGATTLSKLADVAVGSVLVSGGVGTAPAWSATPSVTTVTASGNITSTAGTVKGSKNSQTGYASAGVMSEAPSSGDALITLLCGGSSAAALRHARGGNGFSVEDSVGATASIYGKDLTATEQVYWAAASNSNAYATGDASFTDIYFDATDFLRFTRSANTLQFVVGNVGYPILSASGVYPTTDNTLGIGVSSNKWLTGYITTLNYNDLVDFSDKRFKTHVAVLDGAWSGPLIDRLQPVRYTWTESGKMDIGFYAQDVAEVLPEAAMPPREDDDTWGLQPDKLIPLLVAEVQALRRRVAELESKV